MRALLLVSVLVLSGCDTLGDGPPSIDGVDPDGGLEVATAAELSAFQAAWDAAGAEDYRLRYDVVCFCEPQTVDVRVEGGRVVQAWRNGEPFPDDTVSLVLTVDALYGVAADGFLEADAVAVRVLEGAAPLPVSVSVDYAFEIADEEIGYRVVGFEAD